MNFIGTDIISIDKIENTIEKYGQRFFDKIFTNQEMKVASLKSYKISHFAGKFAAKEAVKKAILSSEIINRINLKDIEVLYNKGGAPIIRININIPYKYIHVSISHSDNDAVASAILHI